MSGHVAVAEHLTVQRGAEASLVDGDGRRPLHHAASKGHVEVAAHYLAAARAHGGEEVR